MNDINIGIAKSLTKLEIQNKLIWHPWIVEKLDFQF